MSRILYTSDPHLGHEFLARLRGFVTPAGDGDVAAHDAWYRQMWCGQVTKRDTVYILGDLTVGGAARVEAVLEFMRGLPGTKHFIAGNHDAVHPYERAAIRAQRQWMETFESVQPFGVRRLGIDGLRRHVALSHFPYTGDHTREDRFDAWRLKDTGQWLLHGHTHDCGQRVHGRQIHVGLDAWGRLVEESEIASLIAAAESGELAEREGEYLAGRRRVAFAPMTGADQT